jgi:hypothetical protein
MLTEFEVMVKVTVFDSPEQITEGLTAKLTCEIASDTNDRLANPKTIAKTTDLRKDRVIKRFVLGEKEGDTAGAEVSPLSIIVNL